MSADAELVTCVGPPFSPDAFDAVADAEKRDSPEGEALRAALDMPEIAAGAGEGGWFELGRTREDVAFGTGQPPVLAGYVVLHRQGDRWTESQSGSNCVVHPYRRGRVLARWGLDPTAAPVGPDSSTVDVIVNDEPCASGVGPDERLDEPTVELTPAAIIITFTSNPPKGNQTCPGHPPARRTVALPEALRDRDLLDGGLYPPQKPCRIESGDCVNDRSVYLDDY